MVLFEHVYCLSVLKEEIEMFGIGDAIDCTRVPFHFYQTLSSSSVSYMRATHTSHLDSWEVGLRQKVRFFSSSEERRIRKLWRLQGSPLERPCRALRSIAGRTTCRDWPRAHKADRKIAFASWQGKTNRLDVNDTRKSWWGCVAPHFRRDRNEKCLVPLQIRPIFLALTLFR